MTRSGEERSKKARFQFRPSTQQLCRHWLVAELSVQYVQKTITQPPMPALSRKDFGNGSFFRGSPIHSSPHSLSILSSRLGCVRRRCYLSTIILLTEGRYYNAFRALTSRRKPRLPRCSTIPRCREPDDNLTRLARYRILDTKQTAIAASEDPSEFLRECQITISFHFDVETEFERIHELVNRTNECNFTKIRWSEDQPCYGEINWSLQRTMVPTPDTLRCATGTATTEHADFLNLRE